MTELKPEPVANNPNDRYIPDVYVWNSVSDVDTFFSRFNHDNGYKDGNIGLSIGDRIVIKDGTYNATWIIAGFDMEYNQKAADNTIYNNGYGICMIPQAQVTINRFTMGGGLNFTYKSSAMNNSNLPTIVNKLKNVLGSHIINRNVLLSSGVDSSNNYYSNAYTWTKSHATLMSVGQMTGKFASNYTKYDDGEATYKLPLFNYENYSIGSRFWTRCIGSVQASSRDRCVVIIDYDGSIRVEGGSYNNQGTRPLIYLR